MNWLEKLKTITQRSVQINFKNKVRSLRKIRINVQTMVPDTRNMYLFKEV
jgi:hypothetical protein